MRAPLFVLLLLLLVAGCATSPPDKPAAAFSLDGPPSLGLLTGEARTFDLAVNWDKTEREDVEVTAALEPEGRGVSAKVEKPRLERGVGPAQVTVTTTETAAPGDYLLTIRAKATSGATANAVVKVKVGS